MRKRCQILITVLVLFLAVGAQAQQLSGVVHIVSPGETLAKIAQRYGVALSELVALNGISNINLLYSWQELQLPASSAVPPAAAAPSPAAAASAPVSTVSGKTHIVRRGETLFSIARNYGIPVDILMQVNGIEDPRFIHSGNVLRISSAQPEPAPVAQPAAAEAPPAAEAAPPAAVQAPAAQAHAAPPSQHTGAGHARGQYIVRRGDSLTELGVQLNIDWTVLAKFNQISAPYVLHPGQVLQVPSFQELLSYLPDDSNFKLFYTTNHHPGPRVGVGREIVIELNRQSIYAYENGVLMKRALMSSGKKVTPTVLGDYEIYLKLRSQTMSGPGYSLDNVEWAMYFVGDYAIHGTWWHNNFGTPMSHGCVNLTNADAQWFWNFAAKGTPVQVRY